MNTSDIINIITAISTLTLAAVAIYGETIKRWLNRPRVEVLLKNPYGDFTTMANEIDRFNSAYCYHLSVIT